MMHQCIITVNTAPHNARMHQKDVREIIRDLMALRSIKSERQVALAAGIQQPAFNRFMRGETKHLEFHNYLAIAQYFEVTLSQLIGETPLEPDPKIRAVVHIMEQLPEYKKDAVVAVSSSLAQQPPENGKAA